MAAGPAVLVGFGANIVNCGGKVPLPCRGNAIVVVMAASPAVLVGFGATIVNCGRQGAASIPRECVGSGNGC